MLTYSVCFWTLHAWYTRTILDYFIYKSTLSVEKKILNHTVLIKPSLKNMNFEIILICRKKLLEPVFTADYFLKLNPGKDYLKVTGWKTNKKKERGNKRNPLPLPLSKLINWLIVRIINIALAQKSTTLSVEVYWQISLYSHAEEGNLICVVE